MKRLLLSFLLCFGIAILATAQLKTTTSKLKVKEKSKAEIKAAIRSDEQIIKEKTEKELKRRKDADAATRVKSMETATDENK